jgi:hypothetical protein
MMTITQSDLFSVAWLSTAPDKSTSFFYLSPCFHLCDSTTKQDTDYQWVDCAKKSAFSQLSNRIKVLAFLFFLYVSSRLEYSAGVLATKGLISTKYRLLPVNNAQS